MISLESRENKGSKIPRAYFFIWGWVEGSFAHSWIIFLVAGGAFAVLGAIKKNNKK